jgi:hypothetical protein
MVVEVTGLAIIGLMAVTFGVTASAYAKAVLFAVCPATVMTMASTPSVPEEVVHYTVVPFDATGVQSDVPILIVFPDQPARAGGKPVPVIVSRLPPSTLPCAGVTFVIVREKSIVVVTPVSYSTVPYPAIFTFGRWLPTIPAGFVQVMLVALTTVGLVHSASPTIIVGVPENPVPVKVRVAPSVSAVIV